MRYPKYIERMSSEDMNIWLLQVAHYAESLGFVCEKLSKKCEKEEWQLDLSKLRDFYRLVNFYIDPFLYGDVSQTSYDCLRVKLHGSSESPTD